MDGTEEQNAQAELVQSAGHLQKTLDFLTGEIGFRLLRIYPADDPQVAIICGYGLNIRLASNEQQAPALIRLPSTDPARVGTRQTAPNGTVIEWVPDQVELKVPPADQSLTVTHLKQQADWVTGRAGMRYRDLIPGRQGGYIIASHIQIPEGGPVPDYVHFHRVHFQLIYCWKGWVRVVYQDQGEPFVLEAGDCVLQPPLIRHRVLECSPGLEVIEVGCPAEHETAVDHDLELPNDHVNPLRDFSGQRFVRHQAKVAPWVDARVSGFQSRDLGIAQATRGLVDVQVLRANHVVDRSGWMPSGHCQFIFLLDGCTGIECKSAEEQSTHTHQPVSLATGDCLSLPRDFQFRLSQSSSDLQLLCLQVSVG